MKEKAMTGLIDVRCFSGSQYEKLIEDQFRRKLYHFRVIGKGNMKLKERANKLKTDIPSVFLAFKKKETPWYAKIMAAIVVVYALSPVDLIPDFIPLLGYLDDIIILPVLIFLTVKFIPPKVFEECRKQAEGMWENGRSKKWYYAIPFILIWIAVIALIILAIIK